MNRTRFLGRPGRRGCATRPWDRRGRAWRDQDEGLISEPPEVLGKAIAGALVGTFLGVFLAYGFVGPTASSLKAVYDAETKYYECIRAGLLAYVEGYAPQIAVEFARKALLTDVRPTFYEVEQAVDELPSAT